MAETGEITQLLHAYRGGDRGAWDRLVPLVYDDLRRIARRQLSRHVRALTLDTTALVHEVYLKMARQEGLQVQDRAHLLAVTACAMRQVIVSFARARTAEKRGGGEAPLSLDERLLSIDDQAEQLLDIDRALQELRRHSERMAQVVECRFFGGLSDDETASALDISRRTVQREWMRARAWILEHLST
jgi:RNA polymerase sigma factor (TIGR02999 family)